MFLRCLLLGVMAKTLLENSKRNFTRQQYTSHCTDELTRECLLLAATAVKHSMDNCAVSSFLRVIFKADTYKSMQNSVSDTHI